MTKAHSKRQRRRRRCFSVPLNSHAAQMERWERWIAVAANRSRDTLSVCPQRVNGQDTVVYPPRNRFVSRAPRFSQSEPPFPCFPRQRSKKTHSLSVWPEKAFVQRIEIHLCIYWFVKDLMQYGISYMDSHPHTRFTFREKWPWKHTQIPDALRGCSCFALSSNNSFTPRLLHQLYSEILRLYQTHKRQYQIPNNTQIPTHTRIQLASWYSSAFTHVKGIKGYAIFGEPTNRLTCSPPTNHLNRLLLLRRASIDEQRKERYFYTLSA